MDYLAFELASDQIIHDASLRLVQLWRHATQKYFELGRIHFPSSVPSRKSQPAFVRRIARILTEKQLRGEIPTFQSEEQFLAELNAAITLEHVALVGIEQDVEIIDLD